MALGTIGALVAGSVASAGIGAIGASKAAGATTKAAKSATQLQEKIFNQTSENLSPYRKAGSGALGAYLYEMGLGDKPEGYGGYETSPMATYLLGKGTEAIDASAAMRGGLYSGETLQALEDNRRNIVSADTSQYFDRLRDTVGIGQSASAQQASAGQYYATQAGNAMMSAGNAKANSYLGIANAVQGGISDAAGIYGYYSNPMALYAANYNPAGFGVVQ